AAAAALLASAGPNAIADVAPRPVRRALGKLWAPVPWMLEAAILLQLGLREYPEAGVVALLLVFNAGLGFVQEGRAQATLDALKSRLALVAAVQRDGKWTTVPAETLVPGDLVKLSLGSVVAADVRIVQGSVLLDQSMLTGESLPIEARPDTETYAGALVRRGEAVALVTATGGRTKFGRTAELVRTAKVESSQQKAIFAVVRNLALFNGAITILLAIYAVHSPMPRGDIVPLILVAVLSSIPVALPSMFTLAAAVGARALAREGVLPTRLSAVDEAGSIDILCSDKTGTLTRNELAVTAVHAIPGFGEDQVLALAAMASSDGGQDLVDAAIRAEAALRPSGDAPKLEQTSFLAFDPATKRAEATARGADGAVQRIAKGAFAAIAALAPTSDDLANAAAELQARGYRVLAVASGPADHLRMVGLVALSDPPRADSAALVAELGTLGVRTVMVTGDAPATASVVAGAIGITGAAWATTPLPADIEADDYGVFANVLPEDKYALVKALQKTGHIVGMCGDGANDAPALRQAQMGIAVSTATDVAKSSAGIVLTTPGLGGIVASVREGRSTYQRILTYALRSIVHKVVQVLFLAAGLIMTGAAILTPMLMVLMMVTGDVLAMSSSTDTVRASPTPSVWRIGKLTVAGVIMGVFDLLFCLGCFAAGRHIFGFDIAASRTLAVVILVFSGQAVFYVARERKHLWSSCPGKWLIVSSVIDLSLISNLAVGGVLMSAIPLLAVAAIFAAAVTFAILLDLVKLFLFARLGVA
ncbi:MAG TPA: HAD-IC family P-type ATPase, partial [Sphingomonas sp.]